MAESERFQANMIALQQRESGVRVWFGLISALQCCAWHRETLSRPLQCSLRQTRAPDRARPATPGDTAPDHHREELQSRGSPESARDRTAWESSLGPRCSESMRDLQRCETPPWARPCYGTKSRDQALQHSVGPSDRRW